MRIPLDHRNILVWVFWIVLLSSAAMDLRPTKKDIRLASMSIKVPPEKTTWRKTKKTQTESLK